MSSKSNGDEEKNKNENDAHIAIAMLGISMLIDGNRMGNKRPNDRYASDPNADVQV